MITAPTTIGVPLQADEFGTIRVSGTRVTLETVVARYTVGDSPEVIHSGFPTVPLNDIYAVIAYYLSNRDTVDKYIRSVEQAGAEIRKKFEALPGYKPLDWDALTARLESKRTQH